MKWLPGQPFTAKTRRFRIRSLLPADVNADYVGWWNDPETQAGFRFVPRNWGIAEAKEHVRQFNNKDKFHIGIFTIDTGRIIGFITVQLDAENRIAIPVVCIGDRPFWGTNASIEVAEPLFSFLFDDLGVDKVEGRLDGLNSGALELFHHFGFKKEGQLRRRIQGSNGTYVDLFIYGLLKEEWPVGKKKVRK